MKFSDVLMRCWMQERDPDTNKRKIDQPQESRNGIFIENDDLLELFL